MPRCLDTCWAVTHGSDFIWSRPCLSFYVVFSRFQSSRFLYSSNSEYPPCFNLHAQKFGLTRASPPPNRRDLIPLGGLAPASRLFCRLAVVARDTKRLKVGAIEPRTAVFKRHDVVHNPSRNDAPSSLTLGTHRPISQDLGSDQAPIPGLVEADLGVKGSPGPSVVTMHCDTVRWAITRLIKHRPTTGVAAGSRRTFGHQGK